MAAGLFGSLDYFARAAAIPAIAHWASWSLAAPEIQPLGVGINLLPHAMRELSELGLQQKLAERCIETRELAFYSRHGQFIYKEPRGRFAGYDWPQLSIHRGDLHQVLIDAVRTRLGHDSILLDKRCEGVDQDNQGVTARFADGSTARGSVAIACDGIHSAVRKQLYPDEGGVAYQGINMWRGVTRMKPYLSGASMVMAGWLEVGKLVVYPIRNDIDGQGMQLVNWVAELQSPTHALQDWIRSSCFWVPSQKYAESRLIIGRIMRRLWG